MHQSRIELNKSYYLIALLGLLHLGAISIVLLLSLNIWLKIALIGLCLVSLIKTVCQHALLLGNQAIVQIWQEADKNWLLQNQQGVVKKVTLCGDSVCIPYFVLLNYKDMLNKKRGAVVILPDALTHDEFRCLRVALNG